jgi:hypothetical protein
MNRDELIAMRKEAFAQIEEQRRAGDYGAGAAWARATAERQLKIIDHLLERMR